MDEIKILNSKIFIYKNYENDFKDVVTPNLIHSDNILEVKDGKEKMDNLDGIFTSNKEIKIGIKTADCAPVCYFDGEKIGIAHIGWPGLCTELNKKMLSNFNTKNLKIFIGPFIHRFEIKKDFCFDKLKGDFSMFMDYEGDKIFFNFKDALLSQFKSLNVIIDGRDTFMDLSLPSYRRDKTKDRLLTVISFN
ncbi:TPA: hypothetical protein DIC38_03255 [Candidatus Nomurabacteria bacterium]|nr:MAG: hypothetical protein O210_OD1C00001G0132 [Parcubacteria bacterium RAAC4_OD1_1]HCY26670.1 hypothetical protein [Candidatus Nomurabacteria bacterium]